ncbi:MAG: ABC transporter permease, partial [Candidatus Acidiferrales bacterium]
MNFKRIAALIERDLRKFFRSPALMMVSMVLPLVQLIVLGYAFGGKVTGVKLGFVDMDHSVESRKVREMFDGISAGPRTFQVVEYDSVPQATHDLQTGLVRGLVVIPHDFSRRFYQKDRPRIAFTEDNTDQFISSALLERVQQMVNQLNAPDVTPRLEGSVQLNTVEIYPYVEYVKYLLAGTIALSVFVVAMIGGGITFIDDKARGLHEGYLVTPIKKSELVFGLICSGVIKGLMTGMVLTIIGGLIVGLPEIWNPVRLLYLVVVVAASALAMMSFMFLLMVRVDDPLVPRAIFGVLNTLLFFPSGAVYPIAAFPWWLKWVSVIDPFTYSVHGLRNLTLKSTGIEGIYVDVLVLLGIAAIMTTSSILLFKRQ